LNTSSLLAAAEAMVVTTVMAVVVAVVVAACYLGPPQSPRRATRSLLVAEVLVALIVNTPRHNERAVIRLRLGSLQSVAVAVRDSAQNQPLHTSVRTVVPVAAVSETLLREEVQQQDKDLPAALLAQA
jgi:hypothetical protein